MDVNLILRILIALDVIGLVVLSILITLFALLAGRDGPPALRGVKRWIEHHL